MTEYLTEQEQIELLKSWIKQYAPPILIGIFVVLIASTGWHYWQNYRNRILTHASNTYDEMLSARAQNNSNMLIEKAQKIVKQSPSTPYAHMAALMLARNAVLHANYSEAEKQLFWVVQHSNVAAVRQIARIRLARVYIEKEKPQNALHILDKIDDSTFLGLIQEVRGDAYFSYHDTKNAKEAYARALTALPNAETIRPLLQMKFDNLNTTL